MSQSQDGMTTSAEESQDTPGESLLDSQEQEESQGKTNASAASKKKTKSKESPKKGKAAEVQICTERDRIERVPWSDDGVAGDRPTGSSFTVLSWNVNGIRATAKNGLQALRRMVEKERPDLICFQVH